MRHMNPKLVRLLHEGFSINTLEMFDENQLNVLYKKIIEEQNGVTSKKVTSTEYTVNPGSNFVAPAGSKIENKNGKTIVTTTQSESELDEEEEFDSMNVKKGEDYQDPIQKQGPDGMDEDYISERAVSKQQQKIMGLALSVKKGDTPKTKVSKKVQDMAKKMSKKDLEDFASTKHKGLPKKVETTEGKEKFIQKTKKEIEKSGTEGSFKKYCGGEVTMNCIKKGLKSDDPKIVKKANFAKNIGGYKGAEHKKSKSLEESILNLVQNHLPPHTTKGDVIRVINKRKQ